MRVRRVLLERICFAGVQSLATPPSQSWLMTLCAFVVPLCRCGCRAVLRSPAEVGVEGLCVATTHLFWNPAERFVRQSQVSEDGALFVNSGFFGGEVTHAHTLTRT